MARNTSEDLRLSSNSIWLAATSPLALSSSVYRRFMASRIDRSAPPEHASLPEVTTTPLTAASVEVCFTICSSSVIVVSSSTFIERPGISHVTSAMPSASVSTLKFLKAMLSLPRCRQPAGAAVSSSRRAGKAKRAHHDWSGTVGTARMPLCPPYRLNPLDDGPVAHAHPDAQRDRPC